MVAYESPSAESSPNLDARASKILEEVEIYKTYGRTDQAIEVLIEAVDDGVMIPALVLRLVECYIESDRMPEAKALIDNLDYRRTMIWSARRIKLCFRPSTWPLRNQPQGSKTPPRINELMRKVQHLGEFSFSTDAEFASTPDGNALTLSPLDQGYSGGRPVIGRK